MSTVTPRGPRCVVLGTRTWNFLAMVTAVSLHRPACHSLWLPPRWQLRAPWVRHLAAVGLWSLPGTGAPRRWSSTARTLCTAAVVGPCREPLPLAGTGVR